MPTYEYRCPTGHEFELFQRMSDEPVAACPECGQGAVRLLSTGGGLLFRGDGFYITDYRSEEYRKKAKADAPAATDTDSSPGSDKSSSSASGSSTSDGAGGKGED
jgi:putative FmdB family regulatory protein